MAKTKPKAKPKARIGRPPEPVPQDMVEEIIAWIADGNTLREFCRQPGKPAWRTVYDWLEKDPVFATRFARARDMGHDAIAEDTLAIIDGEAEIVTGENGTGARRDSAHVAWIKNRVEQRMKLLAKWNPKKYGDKVGVEASGSLSVTIATGVPSDD